MAATVPHWSEPPLPWDAIVVINHSQHTHTLRPSLSSSDHTDFCRRFMALLSYHFRSFSPTLALSILHTTPFTQGKLGST